MSHVSLVTPAEFDLIASGVATEIALMTSRTSIKVVGVKDWAGRFLDVETAAARPITLGNGGLWVTVQTPTAA